MGGFEWIIQMSALDDLIASDLGSPVARKATPTNVDAPSNYAYSDESNNPSYKPDPNAMHLDISGVSGSGKEAPPMSALDALIAKDMGSSAAEPAQSQQQAQAPSTLFGDLTRQVGLTGRLSVNGLGGLPLMAGDALNSVLNYIPGLNLQMPSQAANQLMDKAGIPQPQNADERIVQDIGGAMVGAGGFIKAGKALANLASPLARGIGSTMQQLPGMQLIGAAGSGAGGGIAREEGAGSLGQLGSGILGGVLGAIAPSVGIAGMRGVRGVANNLVGAAAPFADSGYVGKQLAAQIGSAAPDIAANIRNAAEYVPGSMPTTAQAGAGSTLISTEKAFGNTPAGKTALADRTAQQNAARWNALNGVAGSPDDLQNAINSRAAISTPQYAEAHANTANVGKAFMQYANIPEMQQAMESANKIASLDAAVGRGVAPVWPTPQSKQINGAALDYTSRALGDMISEAQRAGLTTKAGSLAALKNNVDDWMGRYIPGIGEARSDYATLSSPVNTMEAGQKIQGKLMTNAVDTNQVPMLNLPGYKSALEKAIKDQEPYKIDEGSHKTLMGIGQDLQRTTTSNAIKSAGSDTVYNASANGWLARQLYGQNFEGAPGMAKVVGALGAMATGHPMVGLGLLTNAGGMAGKAAGTKLQSQLQGLLLDPDSLLPFLDSVGKQGSKPIPSSLGRNINQGLLGAFSSPRLSP